MNLGTQHIKFIILCLLFLTTFCDLNAQIFTIHLNVPGNSPDILSQNQYKNINRSNVILNGQELIRATNTGLFTAPINDQLTELTTFNPLFVAEGVSLRRFISNGSFSTASGYNSFGYIKKRYPINPAYGNDTFKNTVIRGRFKLKFITESDKVGDYLNPTNPIPEGERILLLLTVLENVINLTLENEKY